MGLRVEHLRHDFAAGTAAIQVGLGERCRFRRE